MPDLPTDESLIEYFSLEDAAIAEERLALIDQEGLDGLADILAVLPTDKSRQLYLKTAIEHAEQAGAVKELLASRAALVDHLREHVPTEPVEAADLVARLLGGFESVTQDLLKSGDRLKGARILVRAFQDETIRENLPSALAEMPEIERYAWSREFIGSLLSEE